MKKMEEANVLNNKPPLPKKKSGMSRDRQGIVVSLIIFGVLFGCIFFGRYAVGLVGFNFIYSEGDRVGQIVKLSEKGIFWKTEEAGMGITQSGSYVGYWDFSIDNANPNKELIIQQLREAYSSGRFVRIHYIERYGVLPWRGQTSYFVEEVDYARGGISSGMQSNPVLKK